MAQQFSRTDQRRITFLSLLSSAATATQDQDLSYGLAIDWLGRMEEDGFFEAETARPIFEAETARPTQQRSARSARPASRGQSSSRGRDQARGNGGMRDPDGPPSEKQVAFLLRLTEDYTQDEVYDMTKKEVSDLIEDLKD
jgi:hypothetical protein